MALINMGDWGYSPTYMGYNSFYNWLGSGWGPVCVPLDSWMFEGACPVASIIKGGDIFTVPLLHIH